MKKCLVAMLVSGLAYSQVGINTQTPQATLDVTAKTTDGTKPEGLIAPRLTGDQIKSGDAQYNAAQKGTLVYATSAVGTASTKTANITAEGYYSFNGTIWERFGGTSDQDLRLVNTSSHITKDAGVGSNGSSAGSANSVFMGPSSGNNNSGTENIGIGPNSMRSNTTGTRNIAIGTNSLGGAYTGPGAGVATENVALGYNAMTNNINGSSNTAVGTNAMDANLSGNENVAVGMNALGDNISGIQNTAIGAGAGDGSGTDVGNRNIFLGYKAGATNNNGSNNIVIGVNASSSSDLVSNEVTLGNSSNNSYRMFTASWTNASDRRLKHSIAPLSAGLDFVNSLKPSEYVYNNENKEIKTMGFIAQEVQESLKKSGMEGYKLVNNLDSQYLGLNTGELIPVLTKAIQEQQKIILELQKEVEALKRAK
ncbi:tail fiber domain-containing protein [Chryseobacterium sp.]|uniref:tail fiber domain-containing protein n=1 Tax=Chryseobacterium sp. TaxID=1871047 RepID=UPI002FC91923